MSQSRKSEYGVNELFLTRWSSRVFADKEVSNETIMKVIEAATTAPSAMNAQPWRFVVATSEAQKEAFYSFIMEGNLSWCKQAPVLILLAAHTESGVANFDCGTAWGYLSIQAASEGLNTRAMGGFERAKAKEVLNLPSNIEPQIVIALGYRGEKSTLPEKLQEREGFTPRNSVEASIISF